MSHVTYISDNESRDIYIRHDEPRDISDNHPFAYISGENPDPLLGCPMVCVYMIGDTVIKSNAGDGVENFETGLGPRGGACVHCSECTTEYGMECQFGATKR